MSQRIIGLLLIAVVAVGAVTGVAAAEESLGVTVEDADGEPTVTVTENDTAVENATVIVGIADDETNVSYAGTGAYATDENGTVELPAPEEDVGIEVTATDGNATGSTLAHLDAPDGLEVDVDDADAEPLVTVTDDDTAVENASVNVTAVNGENATNETEDDANATYVGEGNYTTDENGTVELPAAEETVTVEVTATFENETATTTVELTTDDGADGRPFDQLVREFISNLEDRDGGLGGAVSDFVTENNPGNAPDHAGGPEDPDEAEDDDSDESDAPGNAPDHAGGGEDDEPGPPAHAGPDGDDADESAEESEDDAEEDEEDEESEEDDAEEDDETEEDDAEEDDETEEDDESEDHVDDDEEDETEENEDDADPGNGNGPGNAPGNGNGNQP